MRPTLDAVLLDVAATMARRSTCSRLSVGAVLARSGRIIACGYNGAPAGLPHCSHPAEDGERCTVAVHAEANALINAARHGAATADAELFCTHAPCRACASLIINAGIARVVYAQRYGDGLALLAAAGIPAEWECS